MTSIKTGRVRVSFALAEAFTWGAGVALGVALGAYVTAVGGVGAPGVAGVDLSETRMLALMAGGITVIIVLGLRIAIGMARGAMTRHTDKQHGGK